jgi:hypothetical protein
LRSIYLTEIIRFLITKTGERAKRCDDLVYNLTIVLFHRGFAQMAHFRRLAGSLAALVLSTMPGIALADPLVIPGIGPRQAAVATPSAYNVPQPVAAAPAASNLGGGFFEMVVTGRDPTPGPGYNSPAPNRAYAPTQAASMTARYDPDGQPRRSVDPIYLRQEVEYAGHEKPGTIVIDTPNKFLFLVQPQGGMAGLDTA